MLVYLPDEENDRSEHSPAADRPSTTAARPARPAVVEVSDRGCRRGSGRDPISDRSWPSSIRRPPKRPSHMARPRESLHGLFNGRRRINPILNDELSATNEYY